MEQNISILTKKPAFDSFDCLRYTSNNSQETAKFKVKMEYCKMVISLDDAPLGSKDGIRHICAWDLE